MCVGGWVLELAFGVGGRVGSWVGVVLGVCVYGRGGGLDVGLGIGLNEGYRTSFTDVFVVVCLSVVGWSVVVVVAPQVSQVIDGVTPGNVTVVRVVDLVTGAVRGAVSSSVTSVGVIAQIATVASRVSALAASALVHQCGPYLFVQICRRGLCQRLLARVGFAPALSGVSIDSHCCIFHVACGACSGQPRYF